MLPSLSKPPRATRALNWTSHPASTSGKSGTESPICPHEVSSPWAVLSSHTADGGQPDRSMIHGVQTAGAVTRTRLTEWILLGLSLGLSSGAFRVSRTSRCSLNRHHSEHCNSAVPGQVKLEIVIYES
jgi:hypothetical protein